MESQVLPREVVRLLAEQGIGEFHVSARLAPAEGNAPKPVSAAARLFGRPPVNHFHKFVETPKSTRHSVRTPTTRAHRWDDLIFQEVCDGP